MKFKSNLFGSLAAGLFTAPNMINFDTVFDNLDQKIVDVNIFFHIFIFIVLFFSGVIHMMLKHLVELFAIHLLLQTIGFEVFCLYF